MLKYWLALLLVLHALVLAWHWDAFAPWGHGPNQQREPERLKQQVRPEALKFEVMAPASAAQASEQASALPRDVGMPDAAVPTPALPEPAASASDAANR